MDAKELTDELDRIAAVDADFREALALAGYPAPRTNPHGFMSLLRTIVAQQISKQAAISIMNRLEDAMPRHDAAGLLALGEEELRAVGLSRPKVRYAYGLAEAVSDGTLDLDTLPHLTEEAAIAAITALKGFGQWSGECYCLFSLGHRDVFPADDLALQEALRRLKKLDARPKSKDARALVAPWSPHRSAASIFLWHFYRVETRKGDETQTTKEMPG